jgi:tetratricopeptide (TPR) repeat protein
MGKIGRNAPCPCGSGKKYKKCCLALEEGTPSTAPPEPSPRWKSPAGIVFHDDIDELSNSAVDLIKEGRFDEAEKACKQLLEEYPEQVDGLERMATLEEARRNYPLAAEYYRKAAAFVEGDPGYASELRAFLVRKAQELRVKNPAE